MRPRWHNGTVRHDTMGGWLLWSATLCNWPCYSASRFQPSLLHTVSAKSLPDRSRSMCRLVCGQHQTVNHIANVCLLAKFVDGLQSVHVVEDDTLNWLKATTHSLLFHSFFIDKSYSQSHSASWWCCDIGTCTGLTGETRPRLSARISMATRERS